MKKVDATVDAAVEGIGQRITLPPVRGYLSSGSAILDLALSGKLHGGFPAGRISHIYGLPSTAKTVFMTEPLGAAQRAGGKAIYVDVEGTCDFARLSLFGVHVPENPYEETDYWAYVTVESIEELFDLSINYYTTSLKCPLDRTKPNAMGIDSLSALPSKIEQEQELDKASFGLTRAKMISLAFRKYLQPIANANLALIFVDQSRINVGVSFGPSEVVSGGKALQFYSSVRVHMSTSGKIKSSKDVIVGAKFGFEVVKNKIAAPFRRGEINLLFDYGIDDVGTNLEWLKENASDAKSSLIACTVCSHSIEVGKNVKTRGMKCTKCGSLMRKKRKSGEYELEGNSFRSLNAAIEWVENNEYEKQLRDIVCEKWEEMHAAPVRKERIR